MSVWIDYGRLVSRKKYIATIADSLSKVFCILLGKPTVHQPFAQLFILNVSNQWGTAKSSVLVEDCIETEKLFVILNLL